MTNTMTIRKDAMTIFCKLVRLHRANSDDY